MTSYKLIRDYETLLLIINKYFLFFSLNSISNYLYQLSRNSVDRCVAYFHRDKELIRNLFGGTNDLTDLYISLGFRHDIE